MTLTDPATAAPSIPFHVPDRPDVERFLVDARVILESGRLSIGPYVEQLEQSLGPVVGPGTVVAVSNCSDGLIAALAVLGEPGGEVIVPGFTFLATWQAVVWSGMRPVVADVDERGLLDPDAVEAAVGPATRAIIGVHLAGNPLNLRALRQIADRHGLALIFDAAHALGASWEDRPVGAGGDVEVFSIGPTKPLGVSEGGLVVVNRPDMVEPIRGFARQGHRLGELDAISSGMNLRMPELTAALAIGALPALGDRVARRNAIMRRYAAAWSSLPLSLSLPHPRERSSFKDALVFVDDASDRTPVREHLAARGIQTRDYYDPATPDLTMFSGRVASSERSRDLARRSFAVPIHGRLTDGDVDRIVEAMLSTPAWA
jgi:dTDP-4-amino-4,6-dideoxy-D-glucose transaminase